MAQYQSFTAGSGTTSPISFAHDAGSGTNRVTVIGIVGYDNKGLTNVTACTYGGTSLTEKQSITCPSGPGGRASHVSVWLYDSAESPSGSNTVSVSMTDLDDGYVFVWTFNYADYATDGLSNTTSGTGSSISVSLGGTTGSDSAIIMVTGGDTGLSPFTHTGNERADNAGASFDSHAQDTTGAISSYSVTANASDEYAAIALEIVNLGTAPTGTTGPLVSGRLTGGGALVKGVLV